MNEIQSPHYVLVIDQKRNTVLAVLFQSMNKSSQAHMMFSAICIRYGITEDDIRDLYKEVADKEHAHGWCEDPLCSQNKKTI